jgi:UDP-2,3-diacylglucosamine hydrolase
VNSPRLLIFASDIHLEPGGGPATDRFITFLTSLRDNPKVEALYLLGDVFEYWLGRGHEVLPDYQKVLDSLRQLRDAGKRLVMIWGNRDFLVEARSIEHRAGLELAGDELFFTFGPTKLHVLHGDILCTADVGYQRFRRFIRSWPVLTIARWLPARIKRSIAHLLRKLSSRSTRAKSEYQPKIMDYDEAAVKALFQGDTNLVIAGHIHHEQRRAISPTGTLCVLGAWHHEAPFLVLSSDGRFHFARDTLASD